MKSAKNMVKKCEKLQKWRTDLSYDVVHTKFAQEFLDSNFWKQIPDFATRLTSWPGNKNAPYGHFRKFSTKTLFFWTLAFSFVWIFTDFHACVIFTHTLLIRYFFVSSKNLYFSDFLISHNARKSLFSQKQNGIPELQSILNGTRVPKKKKRKKKGKKKKEKKEYSRKP